jgi:hypothetical protein
MASTGTAFIITAIILLVLGFVLRTVVMMRSSDATSAEGRVLHGRELVLQYRHRFPKSPMPLLAQGLILSGALLLIAGIGMEISR